MNDTTPKTKTLGTIDPTKAKKIIGWADYAKAALRHLRDQGRP
jgi:hypothetical protein